MDNSASALTEQRMDYAAVYGLVLLLGLPLNAVSLWTLINRHKLKTPSLVFMTNLSLSDLLLVLSLPTRVYFYATGRWPFGIQVCTLVSMLFRSNIRSSSIFITLISLDRLLAVVFPLRSKHLRTTSNAWKVCFLVWAFIVGLNIPEGMQFANQMHECNTTICFQYKGCKAYYMFFRYFQAAFIWTMLAVNVVSTVMMSLALRNHLSNSTRVYNNVNIMLIFVMNLLMFAIFFVPVFTVLLFQPDKSVIMAMACLASVNCCFDPLFYYFSLDGFWKKREDVDVSLARGKTLENNISSRERPG